MKWSDTKNLSMTKLLEKDIQKLILDWLQMQKKTYVWRQNSGAMYAESKTGRHGFKTASVKGVSDIIGIWQGMPIAIEVKRPGEKPTENQQEFMENFARAGGISICAHSLEEVKRSLKQVMENGRPYEGVYIRNI